MIIRIDSTKIIYLPLYPKIYNNEKNNRNNYCLFSYCFNKPNVWTKKVKQPKYLENKVFVIGMNESGKKDVPDELTFRGFKLKSNLMTSKYGFQPGAYTFEADSSDVENPYFTFEAISTLEKEEVKYTGIITGDEIEGTASISKGGKVKKEFNFAGTLKNPKKKK